MMIVILAAFGVGGATMAGALAGFIFKRIPNRFNNIILGFAAGVMLSASAFGLIQPALEGGGFLRAAAVAAGILTGAFFLNAVNRFVPCLERFAIGDNCAKQSEKLDSVMLFVLAIAIHNMPEGIAAGVSFGSGNTADALAVVWGIALQNVPEGMVIIAPLLAAGTSRGKTLAIALFTGAVEVVGTFLGYFAIEVASSALPFILAFAGGTMLHVISDEMIPEIHADGSDKTATYALLFGFCSMILISVLI